MQSMQSGPIIRQTEPDRPPAVKQQPLISSTQATITCRDGCRAIIKVRVVHWKLASSTIPLPYKYKIDHRNLQHPHPTHNLVTNKEAEKLIYVDGYRDSTCKGQPKHVVGLLIKLR